MHLIFRLAALAATATATAIPDRKLETRATCNVRFQETVTTSWGEGVSVIGSIPELGNWNTNAAIPLSADQYTEDNPLWTGSVGVEGGTDFQYKYIKFGADGGVTWEADPNRSYTVPAGCSDQVTRNDNWQSTGTSGQTETETTTSTGSASSCTHGPNSRGCWDGQRSIDTDFDSNWPTTGRTVYYNLDITNITMAPDGFSRQVLAINGQFPGPRIEANWGDYISITVTNNMPNNGTDIHFHGIRQWHSNTEDGVPGVTSCPIPPGGSRVYYWQATQYGTSWYHSHFSSQYGDGVTGPILIHGPATADYDIDLGPLPMNDWYYPTVATMAYRAEHQNSVLPPSADNVLLNGSMTSNSGGSYSRTTLTQDRKHRLRIINMSVDNHLIVSLDGHNMQVITADFVPIEPYTTNSIFVAIGQRYDVIIEANQTPGAYWFRAEVPASNQCGQNWNNGNIRSIFSYEGFEGDTPSSTQQNYAQRCTDEQGLVPHWNSFVPQGQIVQPEELTTAINLTTADDGSVRVYWNINGNSLDVMWDRPTLAYVKDGQNSFPDRSNLIHLDDANTWTYWVIQETTGIVAGQAVDVNVPHPIHLHGHDFYVLGKGNGQFTPDSANQLNYDNPTRRDSAMLDGGGWLAIAFQTDNPGAWVMHCHIAWHADEGLSLQFLETPEMMSEVNPIPQEFDQLCDAWEQYFPQRSVYDKTDSGI
ncbi:hypothetical protein MBLNU230_g6445t1 [Neophaeotheca triangularis]